MKAGFIQFNPSFGDIDHNIKVLAAFTEGIDCDLLVLPELCTTRYLFVSPDAVASLSEEIPEGRYDGRCDDR